MSILRVVMAQINPLVGDIGGNTDRVIDVVARAKCEQQADVVVFPELTLCGYPPEDLLLRPSMVGRIEQALQRILPATVGMTVVLGYPRRTEAGLHNMAGVLADGKLLAEYAKQELPNYEVFDEKRYFVPGGTPCVVSIGGVQTAITICEDIWFPTVTAQAKAAGARLMLNLSASPFHRGKQRQRRELFGNRAREGTMPLVYVNQVGGQDELVFDGCSFVLDASGEVVSQAPMFEEGLFAVDVEVVDGLPRIPRQSIVPEPGLIASIYNVLVAGVRDYVNKNGFKGVVLGLSGGIDSALTLAVAVDALGPNRVEAVMMPFRYTSRMSKDDAADEAQRLGVLYRSIDIEAIYDSFMAALASEFAGAERDATEENIQARARGVLMMAISNKKGYLVLTTGNKSEMSVGYATLYGDMAGGFAVLKDVPKTTVYELARYRNTLSEVIPVSVIERAPSAELSPDQKDEDSLPPYSELDPILELYVEKDYSAADIIAKGFAEETVRRVIRMVDLNEYKRRQAPVGVRITQRGFGRDRRYPITNGWKI